ncbi:MAG: hypothetical protein HOA72_23355, partial [Desulfobacula sp.]|nr:hypothetical protein [Desulfobacula sp.]
SINTGMAKAAAVRVTEAMAETMEKAEKAFEKRQRLEDKIRIAQTKKYMRSPREILKDDDE